MQVSRERRTQGEHGKSAKTGLDLRGSYPDPDPLEYGGGVTPDTPVVDHNLARALGGHPTDPENLDVRAWSENARKDGFEGQYAADRAKFIEGGLTPEQADWVLEGQLHWIQNDIHATPVDPAIFDTLESP